MIRRCEARDLATILEIINDAARAYRGVITADRWHDPYMSGRSSARGSTRRSLHPAYCPF